VQKNQNHSNIGMIRSDFISNANTVISAYARSGSLFPKSKNND
jgi:hypothetical protein